MPNTTETNAATTAGAVAALKNATVAEIGGVEAKVEAEAKSIWSKIKPYVIYVGIALVSGAIGHLI